MLYETLRDIVTGSVNASSSSGVGQQWHLANGMNMEGNFSLMSIVSVYEAARKHLGVSRAVINTQLCHMRSDTSSWRGRQQGQDGSGRADLQYSSCDHYGTAAMSLHKEVLA